MKLDQPLMFDQPLVELVHLNFTNLYFLGVVALGIICWRLKEWL